MQGMPVHDLDFLDDEGPWGTVFRDVVLLTLIGFVAMVVVLLPHITLAKQETEEHKSPGNIVIEMHWPNELAVDMDLWVQAPRGNPVGFWNQGGETFNLLRDDLGLEGDATEKNYEVVYSRGIPAGEYVVNVHAYGIVPRQLTIPVSVVVSVRQKYDNLRQILQTVVNMQRRNQEETAFRFRLTAEGKLVDGSVSTLRKRLITRGR